MSRVGGVERRIPARLAESGYLRYRLVDQTHAKRVVARWRGEWPVYLAMQQDGFATRAEESRG